MRYIHLHSQDIYNFLSNNDLLHRRVKFLCIKSEGLKYIFCKQTQNVAVNENSTITVLNGYNCEVSNLLTKPACMSEEDYQLIPDTYKGNKNVAEEKMKIGHEAVEKILGELICGDEIKELIYDTINKDN